MTFALKRALVIQYDLNVFIFHQNSICCSDFPTIVLYAFLRSPTGVISSIQTIFPVTFITVLTNSARWYAVTQLVERSIPDGVTGIFH
jgi:hypothetical protein